MYSIPYTREQRDFAPRSQIYNLATNSDFQFLTIYNFDNFQFWQLSILAIFNVDNLLYWQISTLAVLAILATFNFGNFQYRQFSILAIFNFSHFQANFLNRITKTTTTEYQLYESCDQKEW